METENLQWEGDFQLYARVLDNKQGRVSGELFTKLEDFFTEISFIYLGNRPKLNEIVDDYDPTVLSRLNDQVGNVHDNFNLVTLIEDDYFGFNDEECQLITKLVEEMFTQEELTELSDSAFEDWREHEKLGDPNAFAFNELGERLEGGIPHINHANDLFGKELYDRFREQIIAGEQINVLDLGGGTGGTTEALVNWVCVQAEKDGVLDKVNLNITGVEYNKSLAGDFEIKAKNLQDKYLGATINISVEQTEMSGYVSEAAKQGENYHAVVGSYSMHHLKRDTRKKLMEDAYSALVEGGVFMRADPVSAMSHINRFYFNWTDEGTFASFDNGEESASDMAEAGFKASNALDDEGYRSRIIDLVGKQILKSLFTDYRQKKGYITIAEKTTQEKE